MELNETEKIKKAIMAEPENVELYCKLALSYYDQKDYKSAIKTYEKVLELKPDSSIAYNNLGFIYSEIQNHDKAIENYQKAIELNPAYTEAYNNLGLLFNSLEEYEKAIEVFNKSIELNPNNAEVYNDLGVCWFKKQNFELAIECYKKALELKHDFADAYSNLSTVYFTQGNFEAGYDLYELRFFKKHKSNTPFYNILRPKWNGNSIKNKTIYVYYEQGNGDTIMFSRYLPLLESLGAKVLFKPQKELKNLFQENNFNTEIINFDIPENTLEFDEHIPLLSLPRIFKTNPENIPYPDGYLKANTEKVKFYKEKYFNNDKYKVGIFWQGNPKIMKQRAVKLENFYKLANIPNIKLYSLQKGCGIEQLEALPTSTDITDLGSEFNDYSDTAAAIANLDLVISVDSSVAHLAGAMNKPVWILLSKESSWRWFLDREDSPWYKSARLFRQKELNNWNEVFDRLLKELKSFVSN